MPVEQAAHRCNGRRKTKPEVEMYSFIARQPIFDASLNTVAYELLY
ncbi:signal transduction protein, partial [Cronobacter sakazakii]